MSLAAAFILVLSVGCGPSADDGVQARPERDVSPSQTEPHPAGADDAHDKEPQTSIEPGLERLIDLAVEDLAARTGAERADIAVVSAEPVVWPDSSLGCPRPGMRYTQVPQDGALIVLELDGRTYRYHSGGPRAEPFLCEQKPEKTPPPTLDPSLGEQT